MRYLIFIFFIFINIYSKAQKYTDSIYNQNIKTVVFEQSNANFSYPILKLNEENALILSFDYLNINDENIGDLNYKIIHCNHNWTKSDLFFSEYINGYEDNFIYDYQNSFNTHCKYYHYELKLPNNDIEFIHPGNYIIKIYKNNDPDDILFTRKFYIVENKIDIETEIKQPQQADLKRIGQQIDIKLITSNIHVSNPLQDIYIIILKNGQLNNKHEKLTPSYIENNQIHYNHQKGNVFLGGSEYYIFDTKDVKFAAMQTAKIIFDKNYYHFYLEPDIPEKYKTYTFRQDFNGKYYIKNNDGFDSKLEADYVWVHFFLDYPVERADGDFYIYGALTNWKTNIFSKLSYNNDLKKYEASLFLKQGLYNYKYIFIDKRDQSFDFSFMEGSHYETENDYIIFVYHRDYSFAGDKIIGYKIINTINKY